MTIKEGLKKIEKLFSDVKLEKIDTNVFRIELTSVLSQMFKTQIPIVIIDSSYPQIFVNCDIQKFKFVFKGLYISTALFEKFSVRELTAALLHEVGHVLRIKKDPSLVGKFFISRTTAYAYLLIFTVATTIAKKALKSKYQKALYYTAVALVASAIILFSLSLYFYHKVGKEEYISDSLATKLGYGKELVSFIKRYKELEQMYGYSKITVAAETVAGLSRRLIQLLKLHPSDSDRICEITRQIIELTDKNVKVYNMDTYEWAKDYYKELCKGKKPINPETYKDIEQYAVFMLKKLRRK